MTTFWRGAIVTGVAVMILAQVWVEHARDDASGVGHIEGTLGSTVQQSETSASADAIGTGAVTAGDPTPTFAVNTDDNGVFSIESLAGEDLYTAPVGAGVVVGVGRLQDQAGESTTVRLEAIHP